MKRMLPLLLILLFMFSCSEIDEGENWTPPHYCNISFTPEKVKRGEELTITYQIQNESGYGGYISDVKIVDGNPVKNGKTINTMVRFNTVIKDGAKAFNDVLNCEKKDFGNDATAYHYNPEDYTLGDVYPEKYTSFSNGSLTCIVPDKAVSGKIVLRGHFSIGDNFSAAELKVVDDSGNEITK